MEILTSKDLETILKLSDIQAKALMRTKGFPAFRIGREYRVTKEALLDWINNTKSIKLDYNKC